jgi:glycosyltransferase involved in cell wall biosynthesis
LIMSASAPPRVTIGVPVYNGERFIDETLQSLLSQTFREIEIVVCDNCSTDQTPAIVARYARDDSRVTYVRNETNVGSTGNVRRVGSFARAEYFKLANADDVCAPDFIESCVAVLDQDPAVVLCYSKTRLIDADGCTIREYDDGLHLSSESPTQRFRQVISRVRLTNAIQGVIRGPVVKQLFKHYGSYDGADEVMLAAISLHGQFHEVPRTLFARRLHDASASARTEHAERQEYLDPRRHIVPAYLSRIHYGYLREIVRGPVTPREKMTLTGAVLHSLGSQRAEWAREIAAAARAAVRG